MIDTNDSQHRSRLQRIARKAMLERGLLPDFSAQAIAQLNKIEGTVLQTEQSTRDLKNLLWCSIDNDDSDDLDQLTVAIKMPEGAIKVLIAIADVDAVVKKSSPIDEHAKHNTTSIYTAGQIFPMLPNKLSTDITSLNYAADRLAIVVEITLGEDGVLIGSDLYKAIVCNQAKLAYNSVAAWLEDRGPLPEAIAAVEGLAENIRLQHQAAQKLKALRHMHGALDFETIETRPIFVEEQITIIPTFFCAIEPLISPPSVIRRS